MSGMKFRLQCSSCNAAFFSIDRKARLCPKCFSKRAGRSAPEGVKPGGGGEVAAKRPATGFIRRVSESLRPKKDPEPPKDLVKRPPKAKDLTPELREQIARAYEQEIANGEARMQDVIVRVSDRLWVTRQAVTQVIHKIAHPDVEVTPEMKARAIEMYSGYVARGERPPGGRRNTIGKELGIPFRQVRDIVYEWAQSQYSKSPTSDLTREQRFEVEKMYWDELDKQRYRLEEIPVKIAERLGYTTAFQVSRWLDTLHDDEAKFAKAPAIPPEVEQRILDAYQQYLAAPKPPEQGLHFTIANLVGGISQRQVHMVLQRYRNRRRNEYPLK